MTAKSLTDDQIEEARRLRAGIGEPRPWCQSDIAKHLGVSQATICRVLRGHNEVAYMNCAFCNDPFPMKGKKKYCDRECAVKAEVARRKDNVGEGSSKVRRTARTRAVRELIERHQDEFDEIFADEFERVLLKETTGD